MSIYPAGVWFKPSAEHCQSKLELGGQRDAVSAFEGIVREKLNTVFWIFPRNVLALIL
jgi:hypothetical protein